MTAPNRLPRPDKPLFAMTDDELAAEREKWNRKIVDAPGWGAAVAAAHEFRDDCDRELRRRGLDAPDEFPIDKPPFPVALDAQTDEQLAAERALWQRHARALSAEAGLGRLSADILLDACDREIARRATRRPRPAERCARTVVVPVDILDRLAPHAVQRGLTVNALVRDLLDEIAERGLVGTVLDDGDPDHG